MKPARRRATYEDVLNAPEHVVAEVVEGELYPPGRTLEVGRRWVQIATHIGDEIARIEPFEEIEFDLSRWWISS